MKISIGLFTVAVVAIGFSGCSSSSTAVAKLGYPLPRHARYTVTEQQFEAAVSLLEQDFLPDTNRLQSSISAPAVCGPGLWALLKDSPHFSAPLKAKATGIIPLANGQKLEVPTALIQDENEAANFRAALAELLAKNGTMKFRLPTEREFNTFWAVTPFDTISDPLVVAEGERYNVLIEFAKGKPFWFDEVKTMSLKR